MTKIKFDLSDSDPEKARAGTGEPPQPGVYSAVTKEINPGFSKDETTGQPDKTRPRLEVVVTLTDDRHKGYPMWTYLSFSEAGKWKLDQYLQAYGVATDSVRKGEFDTKDIIGKPCRVRVRGGTAQDGQTYRPEIAAVLPAADGDPEATTESMDSELASQLEDDGFSEESGDAPIMTEADLNAMQKSDLGGVAKELGIPYSGKRKADVIAAILEKQAELVANASGDVVDDEVLGDDEMLDDEEVVGHTEESLTAMEVPQLKEVAKEFDIVVKGKTKRDVIAEILAKQAEAPAAASEDDTPW